MPFGSDTGCASPRERDQPIFSDCPMTHLEHSFSSKALLGGNNGSPFGELASLPYAVVQATKGSSLHGSLTKARRAASAQPFALNQADCKAQRASTAMVALDVDELIAGFTQKPLPFDVSSSSCPCPAAAAPSGSAASEQSMLLELVAEESRGESVNGGSGEDACDQDQELLQQPHSSSAAATAVEAASPAVQAVLEQYGAAPLGSGCNNGIAEAARALIWESGLADTFYTYDLGEVARLFHTWTATMPRVEPFYAVKCNPEPGMVAMLEALGAGFDCASIQELERAAALVVPQDRIIFANPCKRPADFRYAAEKGVETTTFDCASELEKIAAWYPYFKCVLRIRCDDADAKINLGLKYGADMADVPYLLSLARSLGLQVVGVSFHVGSGCQNVGVYAEAIQSARQAFDAAAAVGYTMTLLDIGGGFTAPYDPPTAELFYRTAEVINNALDQHFPVGCGVRVIAEPGRYFAETSATLFTTILGQRATVDSEGQEFRDYWLSDGTYGSFRIQVAVDGLEPKYSVLRSPLLPEPSAEEASPTPCRLWGNSDGDGDCVHKLAHLPRLRNGDWLMFPYAGAYTICAASNYGGVRMTEPLKLYTFSEAAPRDLGAWGLGAVPGLGGFSSGARLVVDTPEPKAGGLGLLLGAGRGSEGSMDCCFEALSGLSEGTAVGEEEGMEVSSGVSRST